MFNLFKKGLELNRIATCLDVMNALSDAMNIEIQKKNFEECEETILAIAYVGQTGVFDRMAKLELNYYTLKIMVSSINENRVMFNYALEYTFNKLNALVERFNLEQKTQEIFNKGPLYFKIQNSLPENILKHTK